MIFKPAARYPADPRAVFVLAVSVFSGITAFALEVAPPSLEASMPTWGVYTWGITLALGSAITLVGMLFQSLNGIITEQVGNVMVGAATIFYSTIAFMFTGAAAIQSVGIILAWGVACLLRWGQLQMLIESQYRRQVKEQIISDVMVEIDAMTAVEADRRKNKPGRD